MDAIESSLRYGWEIRWYAVEINGAAGYATWWYDGPDADKWRVLFYADKVPEHVLAETRRPRVHCIADELYADWEQPSLLSICRAAKADGAMRFYACRWYPKDFHTMGE